jgi:hypothetical protein
MSLIRKQLARFRQLRGQADAELGTPQPGKINVLFYNKFFGEIRTVSHEENYPGVHYFSDRSRLQQADAVLFHLPEFMNWGDLIKPEGQIWIGESWESEINYPHIVDPEFMQRIDIRTTYQQDSEVPGSYLKQSFLEEMRNPVQSKTDSPLASCLISNQGTVQAHIRGEFIRELTKWMPVDFYGSFMNNKIIPNDTGRGSKLEVISKYKFNLAFENSRARDYVTEKFFDPFCAGTVPVYWGAPNIKEFAPGEHSFIHVDDYKDPQELAEYLIHLSTDAEQYNDYFRWKSQPLAPHFMRLLETEEYEMYYRLGKKITELKRPPFTA